MRSRNTCKKCVMIRLEHPLVFIATDIINFYNFWSMCISNLSVIALHAKIFSFTKSLNPCCGISLESTNAPPLTFRLSIYWWISWKSCSLVASIVNSWCFKPLAILWRTSSIAIRICRCFLFPKKISVVWKNCFCSSINEKHKWGFRINCS